MLIEKQLSYIFSSNPANGARNVSVDGSQFSVQLDEPISIPAEAISATLECQSSQIWWVVPQISEQLGNNTFYLHSEYIPTDRTLPGEYPDYTIKIPDGLYSLEGLGTAPSREFVNLGLPTNLVTITGDQSTQRVIVTFNSDDPTWIDFIQPNTFREILGFDARLVPRVHPQLNGYSELSDDPANFNQISSFLISTDLISNGIPVNNISSGVVANVLIDVKSGSLINYTPVISVKTDASELIGKSKNFFSFRLTDQDRRTVDTNDEYYSLTVIIRYYEPFTESRRLTSAASRA